MAKEPRDENDPTGLRRFANRIAELKWWQDHPKSKEQAGPEDQPEKTPSQEQLDEGQDQQPPAGGEPSSGEGEIS
jgi:hypothetical protein